MIFDLPLAVTMGIFFFFLGPAYAWGMSKVFRLSGMPVIEVKTDPVLRVKKNPTPWGFLWSNAAVMGILTVVSFVLMVWLVRGGNPVPPYQAYFDLFLAFLSALPAMWWTDSKLREYDKEERAAQRECLRKALEENRQLRKVNGELVRENRQLKKTNAMLNAELQVALNALDDTTNRLDGVTTLFRVYQKYFRRNQIIENNLPVTRLHN